MSVRKIEIGLGETILGRLDTGPVCARGRVDEKTIGADLPPELAISGGLVVLPAEVRLLELSA